LAHPVFYLTESNRFLDKLQLIGSLQIESIDSKQNLRTKMLIHNPELVIVESGLSWVHCLEAISEMDYLLEVPIILIAESRDLKRSPGLVKDAYASGVHDVLFAPFDQDELTEALSVLLKYRETARSLEL
jgi:AmiR/NasT family two-component response regulator